MCQLFQNFEMFTSSPRLKPAYYLPGESEQEHRSRQFRARKLEQVANRTRGLRRAWTFGQIAAEKHTPYSLREVRHIATATEEGRWFSFEVLASNERFSKSAGRYLDFQEGKEAVEATYKNVDWVSPYRFAKEATCY